MNRLRRIHPNPKCRFNLIRKDVSPVQQLVVLEPCIRYRDPALALHKTCFNQVLGRRALGKYDTAIELTGKVYGLPAIVRIAESGIDDDRLVLFEGSPGHDQHFGVGKPMRLLTVQALLKSRMGMELWMLLDMLLADDIRPQSIYHQRF